MLGECLTVKQTAERLNVTSATVRMLARNGELRAIKIGGWRIPESYLKEFIKSRTNN